MPSFNQILEDVGAVYDTTRRKYLQRLHEITGRNIIMYYSAFAQKDVEGLGIEERDKNGFMATIYQLDKSIGLDLLLHTPGGDTAATESIVFYLRKIFDNNIRVIVPQIAMSAGTMIALSARSIIMGKQSSLGPIDPQLGGISAHALIEAWETARAEMAADQKNMALWHPILQKYPITLAGEAQKVIDWSQQMTTDWLLTGMFEGEMDAASKVHNIVDELIDHSKTKAHNRRIDIDSAKALGIKIEDLEANDDLQDIVMSIHHATMLTFERTAAFKVIENHLGVAHIMSKAQIVQMKS